MADESIKCHNAHEIGIDSLSNIVGNNFADVKFKQTNRVTPIRGSSFKVKIHDEYSHVNLNTIFRRMTVLRKSVAGLQFFFFLI